MNGKSPIWNFPFTETRPPPRLSGNRTAEGKEPKPGSDAADARTRPPSHGTMWEAKEPAGGRNGWWEQVRRFWKPKPAVVPTMLWASRFSTKTGTTLILYAFLTINQGSDSEHQVNFSSTKRFLTDTLSHQTKLIQRCTELGSQLAGREEAVWVGRISLKL